MIGGIDRDGAGSEVGFLAVAGPQSEVYRLAMGDLGKVGELAAMSLQDQVESLDQHPL